MELPKPSLISATGLAFERTKNILFRPFDIGKWFILGFTAWLATLLEGSGSSGGNYSGGNGDAGGEEIPSFSEMLETAKAWISEHLTLILTIGSVLLVLAIAVGLAVTWVRSRGKFMFLDNVAHNRALVAHPWKEFRAEGNGLFLWMVVFGLISLLLFGGIAAGMAVTTWPMLEAEAFDSSRLPLLIGLGAGFLLLGLVASYITTLLENFVLPVMYRDRIGTRAAWRKVLHLHSRSPGTFILFYLWILLLGMGAGILVVVVVILTCCIAGIVLLIPYLGAVLFLPVSVFFRSLGMEVLRQFGEEHDPFPPEAAAPPELGPPNLSA